MRRSVFSKSLTLFELLASCVVISIILGTGLAFFSQSRKSYQLRANAAQLSSAIRLAQSFATSNQGLAFIDINPKKNELRVLGLQTVGQWHFEDLIGTDSTGAYGFDAKIRSGKLTLGKIGQGISLQRGRMILTHKETPITFPSGFSLEFYFLTPFFKPMELLHQSNGEMGIRLLQDGSIEGYLGENKLTAKLRLRTWHHLSLTYDSKELILKVDHVIRNQKTLPYPKISKFAFSFGSFDNPVTGFVDEITIRSLTDLQQIEIPQELKLLGKPQRVYFDVRGRLSPQYHATEVIIPMTHPQKQETIHLVIGLFGDIRQQLFSEHEKSG